MNGPWLDTTLPEPGCYRLRIADVTIWVVWQEDSWQHGLQPAVVNAAAEAAATASAGTAASSPGPTGHSDPRPVAEPTGLPEDVAAATVIATTSGRVRFTPRLPDRPVVLRPEAQLIIPAGGVAELYARVPVWLGLAVGDVALGIAEYPTRRLTNTWFGDTVSGELCYGLRAELDTRLPAVGDAEALCPLSITNASSEPLELQRLCLRVPHLTLFEHDGSLLASRARAQFRGEDAASELSFDETAPAPGARQVAPARAPLARGTLSRTFAKMRSLTQMVVAAP